MKKILTVTVLGLTALLSSCSKTTPEAPAVQNVDPHHMDFSSNPDRVQVNLSDSKNSQQVTGYLKDGKVMFQGDLVLKEGVSDIHKEATIETRTGRWTNNTVPYVIDSTLSSQTTAIQNAVNYFNQNTNVRWVPRTTQTNYVRFFKESGCWSYVGMIGGKQDLSLGDGCYGQGTILHEMTHAVGMHHEQSRPDRDQWITINWNVIPTDWHSQFQIINSSTGYGAYDYYSIMHYGLYWGNQLAMTPKVSGIDYNRVGNGNALTATDIAAVNSIYPGGTTPPPTTDPCSGTNCTKYTGSLAATGSMVFHPSSSGFNYAGGTLKGWLKGPSSTSVDFDLFLQKWNGSSWSTVARSESTTNNEAISYAAGSGTYRFRVYSYSGSGSYSFWLQK